MGSIMGSLLAASRSLQMFQRGMEVVQNNVANANTPGYAKQTLQLVADRFMPDLGIAGGVSSPGNLDSRSDFAERAVRRQLENYGAAEQNATQFAQLEPVFTVSEGLGVPNALSQLFQAFSGLTVTPNDPSARQVALTRASALAQSFQSTSRDLQNAQQLADGDLKSTVDQINSIGGQLRELNAQFRSDFRRQNDAGMNAQLYDLLGQLSQLTDANVMRQDDGSVTVYVGGQSLLLIGDTVHPLQLDPSGTSAVLRDDQGNDVSTEIQGGKLSSLMKFRNETLPGYSISLDRLAQSVADSFNSTLAAGVDLNGQSPASPLFTYDQTKGAAGTLAVTSISPDQLALATPDAPGGNGNALALTQLETAKNIDNFTFQQFYGNIAADVGRAVEAANASASTQQQLVTQAQTWRDQISKVDLNEEAARLVQYQTSYQAAARMITALDEMTQTLINMFPAA